MKRRISRSGGHLTDGLLAVRTFVIPAVVLRDTIEFLRDVGREGFEGFVLWGGERVEQALFEFRSAIIPNQRAMLTDNGLLVTVEGQALFEVNQQLHERGEILAAQVHSHPTEAYHSSTDDQFAMATLVGALSIVIPDFARYAPADMEQWACYRLSAAGRWDSAATDTRIELR